MPGDAGMGWGMKIRVLLRINRTGMCWGSRVWGNLPWTALRTWGTEEGGGNRKGCTLDHKDAPAGSLSDLIVNYHYIGIKFHLTRDQYH